MSDEKDRIEEIMHDLNLSLDREGYRTEMVDITRSHFFGSATIEIKSFNNKIVNYIVLHKNVFHLWKRVKSEDKLGHEVEYGKWEECVSLENPKYVQEIIKQLDARPRNDTTRYGTFPNVYERGPWNNWHGCE